MLLLTFTFVAGLIVEYARLLVNNIHKKNKIKIAHIFFNFVIAKLYTFFYKMQSINMRNLRLRTQSKIVLNKLV